jgi:transcriptional regulator with XRE-family HTH domain
MDILMTAVTFGQFLREEIDKRKMSQREFADYVGAAHGVINKFLDYGAKDVGYPSVDFLLKLSKATNTDICYLMALLDPEVPRRTDASIYAMRIGEIVEALPEAQREMIDNFLLSLVAKQGKKSD